MSVLRSKFLLVGLLLSSGAWAQVVIPGSGGTTTTTPAVQRTAVVPTTCSGTDKVYAISSSGVVLCKPDSGGSGSSNFADLTSGTNVTANMVVGSGATLGFTGTGYIDAKRLAGTPVSGPATSAGQIPIFDGSSYVPGDPLIQGLVAHDAAASGVNPALIGCYASAAAQADVGADLDSVRAWCLRNGSLVVNLAIGGTLIDPRAITSLPALPPGTNNIGDVDVLTLPALPTGANTIGAVNLAQYTPVNGRLPVDASGVTQPVSGTVTANAGTGPFPVSDNAGSLTVDAPAGTPVAVRLSDGSAFQTALELDLDSGAGTQSRLAMGLAAAASGGAVAVTATGSSLNVNCTGGCVAGGSFSDNTAFTFGSTAIGPMGAVVDDTATNTVTENSAGAPRMNSNRILYSNPRNNAGTELATQTNPFGVRLSDGTNFYDGTKTGQLPSALVGGRLDVNIGACGTGVCGTEYTEGDVDTTIAGPAVMWEDSGDTLRAASIRKALPVQPGMVTATGSAWTSATSVNATQDIFTLSGSGAVLVHLVQTSTITAGAITFEVSYDGTNWVTIPADAVLDPASTTFAQISLPYTLQASTNKPFLLKGKGWQGLRIKLSTAITGTGSVTPNWAMVSYGPANSMIALSPTAANFNATVTQATAANLNVRADTSAATGSAVPSRAEFIGGRSGANTEAFERCDSQAFLNMSTATTTEIVALTASQSIRVCSYRLIAGGTTNVKFVRGTGINCGTGTTDVSANFPLAAQSGLAPSGGASPIYIVTSGNALCVTSSAAVTVAVEVSYTKY